MKNIKINNSLQRGFTMVELLIYMGIFSILLIVLTSVFVSIIDTHLESQSTSSVSQDANFILTRLTADIRNASDITQPPLTNPVSTSNTLQAGNYTYQLSGDTLLLTDTVAGTTDRLNSVNTSISDISFTTIGNTAAGSKNTVQIVLKIKSTVVRPGGNNQPVTFRTTVGTR